MTRGRREYNEISKKMAFILRHKPWLFEIELNDEGWTSIDHLLAALRSGRPAWADLERSDLERLSDFSDKTRYEISGDRIRAFYGHSIPGRLKKERTEPPEFLYHGTSGHAAECILDGDGLQSMSRQYVHLSSDTETASQVGRRKGKKLVVLVIEAGRAHRDGIAFYLGNESVWLADSVPAEYISVMQPGDSPDDQTGTNLKK